MYTGAAVAVMLTQMQDQVATGNLAVKRSDGIEAMIPIDLEAQEPKVKLVCLGNIEDAQNRDDRMKANLHQLPPSGAPYARTSQPL